LVDSAVFNSAIPKGRYPEGRINSQGFILHTVAGLEIIIDGGETRGSGGEAQEADDNYFKNNYQKKSSHAVVLGR